MIRLSESRKNHLEGGKLAFLIFVPGGLTGSFATKQHQMALITIPAVSMPDFISTIDKALACHAGPLVQNLGCIIELESKGLIVCLSPFLHLFIH